MNKSEPVYLSKPSFENVAESDYDTRNIEEVEGLLRPKSQTGYCGRQRAWELSARCLTLLNVVLTLCLIVALGMVYRSRSDCVEGPPPPYSPLREDGAVRYVNKAFKPQKIFQSETSDEVEAAWNETLGPSEGIVQLPQDRIGELPESIQSYVAPGMFVYGVSMYHQLHCLNRIRKTFYADKFFPDDTKRELEFHKNHCFDLLRQAIMCNGDPSMLYWWNSSFSFTGDDGKKHYSEKYLSMDLEEVANESFVFWDVETRCHDYQPIYDWTKKNQLQND